MVSLTLEGYASLESYATPVPVRPLSVEQYDSMAEAGILTEDDNVELLEGWMSPKMTKKPPHDFIIEDLAEALKSRLPSGYWVRMQGVLATLDSRPEPDLMVICGSRNDARNRHPGSDEVVLVVEVADTSLSRDRFKRRIYARAGIPVYWIVNISEMCVEVYTDPVGNEDAHYASGFRFNPQEQTEFRLADGTTISVPVGEYLRIE